METIDFRCPEDPRHLFLKLKRAGVATPVVDGNLVELACDKCKVLRRRRGEDIARVLHYYNLLGECVRTETVTAEEYQKERERTAHARAKPSS